MDLNGWEDGGRMWTSHQEGRSGEKRGSGLWRQGWKKDRARGDDGM